jgi:hypothetical protein
MFAANVDTAGLDFSCGGHNVFYCFAEDVDGPIDAVTVMPAKVIMHSGAAARLGLHRVGSIGYYL